MVFDDRVWFELPGGARTALAVDQTSEFAALDIDLGAGSSQALTALLDLDASVIRLGPFTDVHRFLPRLSLVAAHDDEQSASAATEIAALPRFMLR